MEINKRNRRELQSYFVKNAIPTESNFAELIDAMLNQKDDGIVKLPGDPLSIEAAGDDTSQKKVINFYQNLTDLNPSWVLSLNPRSDPSKPETARLGFNISDGEGNSRLFIDRSTGNVGIGTTRPSHKLTVYDATRPWLSVSSGGNIASLRFAIKGNEWHVNHEASYGNALTFWNGSHKMIIQENGNVGIGTTNPGAKLEVAGDVKITGSAIKNADNYEIVETNKKDWLRINPNSHYPAIALANPVAIGTGGLAVGSWDKPPTGEIWAKGGIKVQGDRNTHLEADGAFYRYKGEVYITVDNNLYIRKGGGDIKFHFNTNNGRVGIGTTNPEATLQVNGFTQSLGVSVNNGQNTGIGRGLRLWNPKDSNHAIYSANPNGTSPAGRKPAKGFFNAGHRLRLRTCVGGQGFLFENSSDIALIDIDSDNGNLWTRGAMYCGNSDIYFTQTNHDHTRIGNNKAGYAAIENAKDFDALMILGRAGTNVGRKVRLWDYLKVEKTFVNGSDERSKQDIQNLEYGLSEVKKLRPISFNWRNMPNYHKSIGLIGQEVQRVIDEVVYDDDGLLSISYANLIPVLINAIKELDIKVESVLSVKKENA